ncbi:zinc finger domain-containing protein [Kribbella hippodromi]|uniref:zinc finger domain-containing protein n=1 Tax=Kribbella hippodromi TaxID=434347 RepID=UPI003CD0A63F
MTATSPGREPIRTISPPPCRRCWRSTSREGLDGRMTSWHERRAATGRQRTASRTRPYAAPRSRWRCWYC